MFLTQAGFDVGVASVDAARNGAQTARTPIPRLGDAIRRRFVKYRASAHIAARLPRRSHIITVNSEIAVIVWATNLVLNKRHRIVADIYDHHGYLIANRAIAAVFHLVESLAVLAAARVILPIRQRLAQYPPPVRRAIAGRALFISNRGFAAPEPSTRPAFRHEGAPTRIRIGYFGTVDDSRCLTALIDAAAAGNVDVRIHGDGSAMASIRAQAMSSPAVTVAGPYDYAALQRLAAEVDLLWAVYDLSVPNNRYCDPNKFREHIDLDRPIVTNPGHPLADEVAQAASGFVVDPTPDALASFFRRLSPASLAARRPSATGRAAAMLAASIVDNRTQGEKLIAFLREAR